VHVRMCVLKHQPAVSRSEWSIFVCVWFSVSVLHLSASPSGGREYCVCVCVCGLKSERHSVSKTYNVQHESTFFSFLSNCHQIT